MQVVPLFLLQLVMLFVHLVEFAGDHNFHDLVGLAVHRPAETAEEGYAVLVAFTIMAAALTAAGLDMAAEMVMPSSAKIMAQQTKNICLLSFMVTTNIVPPLFS